MLAGGHDRLYPADQEPLLDLLLEEGAAISEMPFGWEARGRDFPRRNRLVSGLSLGVVVVEAARRSGSLITARFAADQGREVFALPGSPLDPRAEGTNDLLRDGATFCCEVDDVLRALADRGMEKGQGDLFSDVASRDEEPLWDEIDLSEEASGVAPPAVRANAPVVYGAGEDGPASGVAEIVRDGDGPGGGEAWPDAGVDRRTRPRRRPTRARRTRRALRAGAGRDGSSGTAAASSRSSRRRPAPVVHQP